MILSIHQPGYFPWLGLLDKVRRSDVFMIMDEVQLSDSAFQHRNLFLTPEGAAKFLTIPFVKKDYLQRRFRDIPIADPGWRTRHRNFLWNSYRSHPFAAQILPPVEQFLASDYPLLGEAVIASMRLAFELMGISTRVILQSEMDYDRSLRRGELVAALVHAAGASCYLSGTGAKAYLDETLLGPGVSVRYNGYVHPRYPQHGRTGFTEGLSCLDVLFNLGTRGSHALLCGEALRGQPA